jgi:hypothetical protein
MVATALEILTIAVAAEAIFSTTWPARRPVLVRSLAVAMAFGASLWMIPPRMLAAVQKRDIDPQQRSYRFQLDVPGWDAKFACKVDQGNLIDYTVADATIRTFQPKSPAPGDRAVAECELTAAGQPKFVVLQVFDPFAAGGLGGRMLQRVEVDGEEVYRNDVGQEPWTGWANIPVRYPDKGGLRKVVIEVRALNPEPEANWAWNSRTQFRLARPSSAVHLAMGRPTVQSSDLSYSTAGSEAAVDGNTDGNFFHGSVTATNREPNAWWQVDLGSSRSISSIVIWNRMDCCASRLSDYWVFVSDMPFLVSDTPATLQNRAGTFASHQTTAPNPSTTVATLIHRCPPRALCPDFLVQGRYVRIQLSSPDYLSLAEVQVFGTAGSAQPAKVASQSSTLPGTPPANAAVDGNTDGNFYDGSVTATNLDPNPWWQVDLGVSRSISSIVVYNRTDCCGARLGDYWVFVSDTPFLATDTPATLQNRPGTFASHQTTAPNPSTAITNAVQGRYVRVQLSSANYLSLAEVQVFGQ